ncbi:MAG TPA: SigB/SigF/SigG family RNA polymerase sigma factor [Thermoleophilaceae bacterium]
MRISRSISDNCEEVQFGMAIAALAEEERAPESAEERRLEDHRLLMRYHREGDLEAREQLVLRFLPLARQLAGRYRHAGELQDDLVQVACVGLLKAVDRFDPDRGCTFTKYAVPTMLGELKRHFRDKGWSVHVPRATQELVLKVSEAMGALPAKLGRSPRPRDVAQALGAPVEDVLEAMEAATAYESTSLEAPRPGGEEDGDWTYADSVSTDEQGYELVEIGETLRGTLDALPPRERIILKLRFEHDMTQAEIAERVGVSQMHVSRLLRRSLDRLTAATAAAA